MRGRLGSVWHKKILSFSDVSMVGADAGTSPFPSFQNFLPLFQ